MHSVRHHAGLRHGYPPLFDWIYDCGSPFPISTDWLGANLSHQTPTEDKGGCGRRPVLNWNKFVMAATTYIFCIEEYSQWEAFRTICSKWLSCAVVPLNQSQWRAFFDIFLLPYLHWVITPSGYFFPPPAHSTLFKCLFISPRGWDPVRCWPANSSSHHVCLGLRGCWFWPQHACHLSS